jgi:mannose-6-phosphate isomerase
MYAMTNPIQRYTWGSHTELARLQRRAPPGEPEAELWMGAHPAAPSVLRDGTSDHGAVSLLEWIVQDPEGMLGADTLSEFGGRLPFLLKILAIESPLSLQVHPDSRQAEQGFADDEARGVPLDAPDRSYWDAAAKPEMLCAVTEVEALCGFRDPIRSAVLLQRLGIDPLVGMARRLTEGPAPEAIREVLARLLAWPEDDRPLLVEAVAKAAHRYAGGTGGGTGTSPASGIADGEAASAYAWVTRLAELYPADPGVVCALLLNHVRLQPGEALVLLAGNLHAYLHGVGVEINGQLRQRASCRAHPQARRRAEVARHPADGPHDAAGGDRGARPERRGGVPDGRPGVPAVAPAPAERGHRHASTPWSRDPALS